MRRVLRYGLPATLVPCFAYFTIVLSGDGDHWVGEQTFALLFGVSVLLGCLGYGLDFWMSRYCESQQ